MPHVRPFYGLLYDPPVSGPLESLTAPPYDAISPLDQDRYYRASPNNVIRLILGRDEVGDRDPGDKYSRAGSLLRSWREVGILTRTSSPSIFPYEMRFHLQGRERRVRGVIGEVALEPWGGSILPHERTMPGPVADRLSLMRSVEANLSPVYGIFSGPSGEMAALLGGLTQGPADREATDEEGTLHRLWVTQNGADVVAEALSRDRLLIADGHHRYTVALAYRDEMRTRLGPGPWDAIMMLLVDAGIEDPPVLPIHRVLLAGSPPPPPHGRRVRDLAEVLATVCDDTLVYGSIRPEGGEVVHLIDQLEGSAPTVCALHAQLLRGFQGEIRFVADAVAAEESVRTGVASVAYVLPPTKVERVRSVIAMGERLPQKSTFFWPKPRTGMVIRPFHH